MGLEEIRKLKLYKQGTIAIPWFVHDPYVGAMHQIGEDATVTYRGKENIGYFNKIEELKNAKEIMEKEKKEEYIDSVMGEWKKRANETLGGLKEEFANMNNEELAKTIQNAGKNIRGTWAIGAIIELFDPWGEELVEEEIEKFKISLNEEEFIFLTSNTEPNIIQKEKIDRLEIAKKKTVKKIREHREKYFFMNNSYAYAEELTEEHFIALLKDPELEKDVNAIKENLKKIKKQKNILKKKLPKEFFRALDLFCKLGNWRERRKKWVMKTNHYLLKLLEELSRRSGIEKNVLEFATPSEINSIQIPKEKVEEFKRRKEIAVYTKNEGWIYGEKAEDIIKALEESFESPEIIGNTACKGYAKGKAKIIRTFEDFGKIQKGDILVTIMTKPEHLPIMKKAAAIVTDEGGITCHAAIVSRELGIPCIVGTQVATRVLKDGEVIEVDASKGTVRRCSL